jgi:hypothetical protein
VRFARRFLSLITVTGTRAPEGFGAGTCLRSCCRSHLKSRFVFTRLRWATSATDTPGASHSRTIARRCSGV